MPRTLLEYSLLELIRLRPLFHFLKRKRYRRIDADFSKLPAVVGDESFVSASLQNKNVGITIAFNDLQAIEWHLTLTKKYVANFEPLVCDNSSCNEAAASIAALCADRNVQYLRLAKNPWSGRNGSRSHGLAMNWVWRRIIRPSQAAAFGFLDHDLFPLAPDDPFALLNEVDFHGDIRWADKRWFLWAGYCFFRLEPFANRELDFGLDWFCGLDTGGANWELLYRHTEPASLPQRELASVAAFEGVSATEECFETRGDWIHEVGTMGKAENRPAKRRRLYEILKPHLEG